MKMNKLLAVTLACSLFAATPVIVAQAAMNNEGPQTVQFADMDRQLADAAEKAIAQYGNGKAFQLEEALKGEYFVDEKTKRGIWYISAKDRSAVVSLDEVSGEVLTVSLTYDMDELSGEYEAKLKSAQAAVKELNGKGELSFVRAHFFKDNNKGRESETLSFQTEDGQFVAIDMKTGKPGNYILKHKAADVDRSIVAAAEQAVKSMGVAKVQPFTEIEHRQVDGEAAGEVWELKRTVDVNGGKSKKKSFMTDGQGRAFVVKESVIIEAKTGKPVSVTIPSNEAGKKTKTLTKEDSIKLVKPIAQKLFDADLSAYTLKIDKDWGDYKFSSKGKETIVAKINQAGELVRIERKVKK
ncbi:hypothetical protein ABEX25_05795 [Paenibacillus thiaminolyticus]|uniref:hypothetical protein n=1 Tax=Paenibacillus thiaminolyticus TaxID=49283 RepID=UPI003D299F40